MENGLKIKPMGREIICTWMEQNIWESGKKINNMEKVLKVGLMVLFMKDIICKERKKGSVCLNGQISLNTLAVL